MGWEADIMSDHRREGQLMLELQHDEEFRAYITDRGILENPLVAAGYPSIGCAPCTAKPLPGADLRSGRC